jgi:hypothetical protein
MSQITRTWLAFAALGAGMIHLALVISSPLPLGIAFALLGLTEVVWGILAFIRDRIAAPRVVIAVAMAPVVVWALALATAVVLGQPAIASGLPVLPLSIATLFELLIAATVAAHLRGDSERAKSSPSAARYLGALFIGAIAVSALTTPALAATEAGAFALPHGEHSEVQPAEVNLPSHLGH